MKKKIGHILEYIFFRTLTGFLGLFPFTLRAKMTEGMIAFFFKISKSNRERVTTHIGYAFPDKSQEWKDKIAKENCRAYGRLYAELIQSPRLTEKFVDKWSVFKPDLKTHADAYTGGGIFIMGHIGDWEWHGAMANLKTNSRLTTFAKRMSNPYSNTYFEKNRKKAGMDVVYTDTSSKIIFKELKAGKKLGVIADQNAGPDGLYIPFMGRLASTFRGPAMITRLTKYPVYFAYTYHDEKKRLNFEIVKIDRDSIDKNLSKEDWDMVFTRKWVEILENAVLKHPTDYFWVHKRWKHPPSEEKKEELWKKWHDLVKQNNLQPIKRLE